jgi:hypothetical protein
VTSIAVSGLDAIRSGFFSQFSATATMSNGTTQSITPTWASDNTTIATVDSSGNVTGVANGNANIAATFQGRSGSKGVRIVSNFGGSWTGTYRITKCDQSGAFAGWCAGLGGVGAILPMTLSLTQGGGSRDQISGTISLGSITGNINGNVTGDGRLILGGSFTVSSSGFTFLFTFGGWETRLSGLTGMTGNWAHSLSAIGSVGNAYQENTIVTATHTSNGATIVAAPSTYSLTLEQFVAQMRQ